MLKKVSKFNDAVQHAIFNPNAMAPTFPESAITKPFPFNAYYSLDEAPEIDLACDAAVDSDALVLADDYRLDGRSSRRKLVDHGHVIALGSPTELIASLGEPRIVTHHGTLEDVFMALTGRHLRED